MLVKTAQAYRLEQAKKTSLPIVGYDCIPLPDHFSGAAYYVFTLAEKLLSTERDFSIAIICKSKHQHLFMKMLKPGDMIIPVNINSKLEQILFYEFKLSKLLIENNITLFHATHYICPPRKPEYSLVTTFHDMGFCFHPDYYPVEKRFYFNNMMKTFLKRSDIALTISLSTADLVMDLFPDFKEKIRIIYPGTDHLEESDDGINRKNLFDVPFILAVNTVEKRKNTSFIIKVFNYLKESFELKHKLVIVGYCSNDFSAVNRELNQSKFKDDITILQEVSEDLLIQLYKQAECFLNASEYEGFGFTPIEAIRFGCPAFILENNITSELFPDYPYLLKEMNKEKWGVFIYSEMLLGFVRFKACEKINGLTWELSAKKTIECYKKLLIAEKKDLVQI